MGRLTRAGADGRGGGGGGAARRGALGLAGATLLALGLNAGTWVHVAGGATGAASLTATTRSQTGFSCATTPDNPRAGAPLSATASSEGVRATLTGTAATEYGLPTVRNAMLEITDGGTASSTEPVTAPKEAGDVDLQSLADDQSSNLTQPLCVVAFPGGAVPAVLLGFYTGGAHCCTIVRAYTRSGAGWTSVDHAIGDPGVVVTDVNGAPTIVTADDSFSYEFTDYAASGDPVEVLTVDHGRFSTITRKFPSLVRSDAAHWWATFRQNPQDDLGVLAAWAADRCELGQQAQVTATLSSLQTRHKLGPNRSVTQSAPFWPSGSGYVTALTSFLVQHGYCPAR